MKHFIKDYIFLIINNSRLHLKDLNISRIDVAADIQGVDVRTITAVLHVKGIKSFRIIEDSIYAGKNPKVRIYNKLVEIRQWAELGQT